MNTITFDIKCQVPLEQWEQARKLGITEGELPRLMRDMISDLAGVELEESKIEGNTAALCLKVKIPKHYWELYLHLQKMYGFSIGYLAKAAADGIIMDINERQGTFGEAIVKPVLTIGSKTFKTAE